MTCKGVTMDDRDVKPSVQLTEEDINRVSPW